MEEEHIINFRNSLMVQIIVCLYSVFMIFYQLFPSILIALISAIFYLYIYLMHSRKYDIVTTLSIISIIAIPTSTISILGGSSAKLPLTWYSIAILISVIYILLTKGFSRKYLLSIFLFMFYGLLLCLLANNVFGAFKQYLMIILFLFGFFVGEYIKEKNIFEINDMFKRYYFLGVISMGFQIIIQKAYIKSTGIIIGHFIVMGGGRVAHAGIMGDYSFATLYLATGVMMMFIWYIGTNKISFFKFCVVESFLLYAMFVISSRTGLISLILTLILYTICNIKKISGKHLMILFACVLVFPLFLSKLMESRGGQALLESSGRESNYIKAIELWSNKIAFGYGLGLDNLYDSTGIDVPHNLIIQYLVQIGLVGCILFSIPLFIFIKDNLFNTNVMKWLFWLVLIGSMFIPDIVSSRFIYGIVLICMIYRWQGEKNEEKIRKIGVKSSKML